MTRWFARVRQAWREYGPAGCCWLVLAKVLHNATGGHARVVPYVIVAQPIGQAATAMRQDPTTVTARIDRHDPVIAEFPREAAVVQQRFDDGAECYVTRSKGVFAGHIWIARGRYIEDDVRCTYVLPQQPVSVWDFDVYVGERFRLGRTMARMWSAVDESLAREGVAWTCSRISMFNPGSLSSHRRLGAMPRQSLVFLVFGRWQCLMQSRWPWLQITPPAGAGPQVAIAGTGSISQNRASAQSTERT